MSDLWLSFWLDVSTLIINVYVIHMQLGGTQCVRPGILKGYLSRETGHPPVWALYPLSTLVRVLRVWSGPCSVQGS